MTDPRALHLLNRIRAALDVSLASIPLTPITTFLENDASLLVYYTQHDEVHGQVAAVISVQKQSDTILKGIRSRLLTQIIYGF
jgi:hypothetical protein